jgi:hypothetical protein
MDTKNSLFEKLLVFRSLSYSYDNDCVFQDQIEKEQFLKIVMEHAREYVFSVYDKMNMGGCQSLKAWQCIAHALVDAPSIFLYKSAVDSAEIAHREMDNETIYQK